MKTNVYTYFNRPKVSGLICLTPSKTKQSFKDEVDLNNVVRKYGIMATFTAETPIFGDFTSSRDLEDAYNAVFEAEDIFSALPSDIRKRFGSAVELLAFIEDDSNLAEAQELGLLGPKTSTPLVVTGLGDTETEGEGSKTTNSKETE